MFPNSPPFRPFLVKSVPIRPLSGPTAHFFIRPLLSYVAEQSASWQYWLQLCSGMGLFREKGDENYAYQVDISAFVGWGRDGEGSSWCVLMKLIPAISAVSSTCRNYPHHWIEAGKEGSEKRLWIYLCRPSSPSIRPLVQGKYTISPLIKRANAFTSCSLRGLVLGNRSFPLGEK